MHSQAVAIVFVRIAAKSWCMLYFFRVAVRGPLSAKVNMSKIFPASCLLSSLTSKDETLRVPRCHVPRVGQNPNTHTYIRCIYIHIYTNTYTYIRCIYSVPSREAIHCTYGRIRCANLRFWPSLTHPHHCQKTPAFKMTASKELFSVMNTIPPCTKSSL